MELPFLGVENLEQEVAVSKAVYAHPAAAEEMAQWNAKLLMTSPMPQYNLVGTGDPRTTLEDFEGMRVRATGGLGKAFEAVGAVPTSVTSAEAYQAMESGVVDTVAFAQHAHLSFGTINQADWWTANLNPGTVNCPVVVNIDAYEALSTQSVKRWIAPSMRRWITTLPTTVSLLKRWDAVLEEKGVEKVEFAPEVICRVPRKRPLLRREAWIADMEAQGLPGQELYDLVSKHWQKPKQRRTKPCTHGVSGRSRQAARPFRLAKTQQMDFREETMAGSAAVLEDSSLLSRLDRMLLPLERFCALLGGLAIFH